MTYPDPLHLKNRRWRTYRFHFGRPWGEYLKKVVILQTTDTEVQGEHHGCCWLAKPSHMHDRSTAPFHTYSKLHCWARNAQSAASRPVNTPVFPFVEGTILFIPGCCLKGWQRLSSWPNLSQALPDPLLLGLNFGPQSSLHSPILARVLSRKSGDPESLFSISDHHGYPTTFLIPGEPPAGVWHPDLLSVRVLLGRVSQNAPWPLMFPLRKFTQPTSSLLLGYKFPLPCPCSQAWIYTVVFATLLR